LKVNAVHRFVFVSHADSGDVHTLAMAPDGTLSPCHVTPLGGTLMPMAQSPCGRWLYVARRSAPMAAITLAIDRDTGALRKLGEAPLPGSMAYISTDATGRFLFAASYPSDLLSVSPISATGQVGEVQQQLPTGRHAHCIFATPSNRHVLATSLGGAQVLQFHFDASTGALTPNTPPAWQARAGAGPRHLRFHPNGRWVYLLNELDATVDRFNFDPAAGTLSHQQTIASLPTSFAGEPWAADMHLTPDGRFLFTSERRGSTLTAFSLDANNGALSLLRPTDTEAEPRGFAITPDGRHLLAVGQASHHLSRYTIDADTAALTLQQRLPMGQNPNWIEITA
jgi:6-phosphogluconolactonase